MMPNVPVDNPMPPAARTHLLHVTAVANVSPRMRRVTLTGDTLSDFAPWPGQDVVLHVTDEKGSGVRRRYTVRNLDRERRSFDLDFVLHGHGPGARWADRVVPGEQVEIFGPRGKVALSDAEWQLFAGDESALPAIAEMALALPRGVTATALIEVADSADEQPIETAADLELRWLHRGAAEPGSAELLDEALAGVAVPASDRHLFLFGESRTVRRLRDAVMRRGVRLDEISAKGYWNLGRAARD
jgi:NADPH-dependent ferric siderophore reductase